MENIHKIWGEKRRIHLNDKHEIDLLYLKKNSFCSIHSHKNKINRFVVIEGKVNIETEFGSTILMKNDTFTVIPSIKHRFIALEDSTMIEIAFVDIGTIDPEDIERIKLGGKIIDGIELTIDDLKEKGLLNL